MKYSWISVIVEVVGTRFGVISVARGGPSMWVIKIFFEHKSVFCASFLGVDRGRRVIM